MIDTIKGIIAKIIIKDNTDYCMYCIIDTINKNINGITYKQLYNIIGKYFTTEEFINGWKKAFNEKYIIQIQNSNKFIIGVKILLYEYEYLL